MKLYEIKKPTEEDILKIKTIEDSGYRESMLHAKQIIEDTSKTSSYRKPYREWNITKTKK